MNTLRVAWRNLWRNRRRTLVTLAAVSVCTLILTVIYCLMEGLMVGAVANTTNLSLGEVQVYAKGYRHDRSFYKALKDPGAILAAASAAGVGAAPRSYSFGLAALGAKSSGARLWGIDPAAERAAFDLYRHVAQGRFLGDRPEKAVVLGYKLAKSLEARVGSTLVVVVQAADGSLGNDLFKVVGILKSCGAAIDRNAALVHRADFAELLVSGGRIHEVALNSRGRMPLEKLRALAAAAAPGQEVTTWRVIMPAASDMLNVWDSMMWLFGLVFILAAALGLMNTMLMATFERIREFGIIRALGATTWRILADVTGEAMILSLLGTGLGALLGLAVSQYLVVHGLDMSSLAGSYSVGGLTFDPVWRATLSLRSFLEPVLLMFGVCLLASIYPAILAARLDPVRAINRV